MCLDVHEHIVCFCAQPDIYPTSSQAEVHADGGKDEPVAEKLAEALDEDEAAECDDAAEMEPGRDPLVPPRPGPPVPAQPVMDLPW